MEKEWGIRRCWSAECRHTPTPLPFRAWLSGVQSPLTATATVRAGIEFVVPRGRHMALVEIVGVVKPSAMPPSNKVRCFVEATSLMAHSIKNFRYMFKAYIFIRFLRQEKKI